MTAFARLLPVSQDLRCLFYWYEPLDYVNGSVWTQRPDVAFVQKEPSQLILPAHSAQERKLEASQKQARSKLGASAFRSGPMERGRQPLRALM